MSTDIRLIITTDEDGVKYQVQVGTDLSKGVYVPRDQDGQFGYWQWLFA